MIPNVLYILPMLLGRTYDLRDDRVGFDIFPQTELNRSRELYEPESVSRYETADSSDEVRKLLEVAGDIALKVKAGKLDLKGTGTYLKYSAKSERTIEILTRVKFKTYTVALPADVKPVEDFLVKFPPKELGTHFVRSVTYGGELLASIRFRTNHESDLKSVSSVVKGSFNGGEASSLVAEGKLEAVKNKVKDKASMEISYYATVPLKGVPNTIDGLRSLVRDFDKHVKEVNNGWGVPIRVELMEMDSLGGANGSQFRFLKNKALDAELSNLEAEFDDLRKAHNRLTEWIKSLPASITKDQEDKIEALYKRIRKALRPYYDAIGKMNIEEGKEQLQDARDAYREDRAVALPGKFNREVDKLKRKINIVDKKLFGTGSSTYIRWGKTDCPSSPMNHRIYSGYVATSTNRGTGGSSQYLCLPEKPSFGKDATPDFGGEFSTLLAGARYGLMEENPFDGDSARNFFGHGIPCAVCHLTNRTLATTFPAFDQCPSSEDDGNDVLWIQEYSGYLMSGSNLPGTYICVDRDPESHKQISDEQQTHSVSLSLIGEGTVPSNRYTVGAAVSCAVCSK